MRVVVFCGAGVSAELGVPAMRLMAVKYLEHLRDADVRSELLLPIQTVLSRNQDMEHAIDIIDKLVDGELARKELGLPVDENVLAHSILREEAEWFVQHSCEQIDARKAFEMWAPVLRSSADHQLSIGSTNYDRAVEITARRLKLKLQDGFEQFNSEFALWKGFDNAPATHLLKLHGSTDWYHSDDKVFKLRHPVALFGALHVKTTEGRSLQSALVLPSREKKTNQPPFPALQSKFRSLASEAEVAFFVGSSLRDPHLRDICNDCARSCPTYVVTKDGVDPSFLPEGSVEIKQTSAQFLISTLPIYLQKGGLPICRGQPELIESPLIPIMIAADHAASTDERCTAIEWLAEKKLPLTNDYVLSLLESDQDDVRLYSLGLIGASPDRDDLIRHADSRTTSEQPSFAEELALLKRMAPRDESARAVA